MKKVYLVYQCFDVPREGTFTQLLKVVSSKAKADTLVRELTAWNSDTRYYYMAEEAEVQ